MGAGPSVWGTCSVVPLGVFGESRDSVRTVIYGDYLWCKGSGHFHWHLLTPACSADVLFVSSL